MIFFSHPSLYGDSSNLINQPYINLYTSLVNPLPINQVESLDNHDPDDFLFFEMYVDDCSSLMDESLFP